MVELVGVTEHLDAVAAGYAKLFPGRVRRDTFSVVVGAAEPRLRFLTSEGLRRRFGTVVQPVAGATASLVALVLRTSDMARCRAACTAPVLDGPAGEAMVAPADANGVLLVLEGPRV